MDYGTMFRNNAMGGGNIGGGGNWMQAIMSMLGGRGGGGMGGLDPRIDDSLHPGAGSGVAELPGAGTTPGNATSLDPSTNPWAMSNRFALPGNSAASLDASKNPWAQSNAFAQGVPHGADTAAAPGRGLSTQPGMMHILQMLRGGRRLF